MADWSEEKWEDIQNIVEEWIEDFIDSDAFDELTESEKENFKFGVSIFADYMYNYGGEAPEEWTLEGMKICCLETLPRKASTEDSFFEDLPIVLKAFFLYTQEQGYIKNGNELAKAVMDIADDIAEEGHNPDNWGMAKSFMMKAIEAGYDPTDEEEMRQFVSFYNNRMKAGNYLIEEGYDMDEMLEEEKPKKRRGRVVPLHTTPKVSKNAPCPCGSGKKYKRCCGKK